MDIRIDVLDIEISRTEILRHQIGISISMEEEDGIFLIDRISVVD